MSGSSEIEEAMEGQDSVGTESVTGQSMQVESLLRTIVSLLGMNQLVSSTVQYEYSPLRSEDVGRPSSAPPCVPEKKTFLPPSGWHLFLEKWMHCLCCRQKSTSK